MELVATTIGKEMPLLPCSVELPATGCRSSIELTRQEARDHRGAGMEVRAEYATL